MQKLIEKTEIWLNNNRHREQSKEFNLLKDWIFETKHFNKMLVTEAAHIEALAKNAIEQFNCGPGELELHQQQTKTGYRWWYQKRELSQELPQEIRNDKNGKEFLKKLLDEALANAFDKHAKLFMGWDTGLDEPINVNIPLNNKKDE